MTNHEMLELAAKAAGYVLTDGSSGYRTFRCYAGAEWNPLTDDGDRYRLAQALRLTVNWRHQVVTGLTASGSLVTRAWGDKKDWPDEAHAIVDVAAEIGRQMK